MGHTMSNELKNLRPGALWHIFNDICSIPHPSGHEDALRDFLKKLAAEAGLKTTVDKTGNLLVEKAASPGMEQRKTVILQCHLDMVPQKNSDSKFDFVKDPISPCIDGDLANLLLSKAWRSRLKQLDLSQKASIQRCYLRRLRLGRTTSEPSLGS